MQMLFYTWYKVFFYLPLNTAEGKSYKNLSKRIFIANVFLSGTIKKITNNITKGNVVFVVCSKKGMLLLNETLPEVSYYGR